MKEIKPIVLLAAVLVVVSAGGCAKAPADGGSAPAQSNKNAGQTNANVQDLSATPLYAKTVRGDIERAGLAISMARDFVKQEQWSEAVVQLRAAQTQIDEALGHKLRVKEQFEELKSALGRAIHLAENRSKGMEAQFTELQTRINALKVYTSE